MRTADLSELLKSLCNNPIWSYAVLWKLTRESSMGDRILIWEDGYCNFPQSRQILKTIADDVHCKIASDTLSPEFETNAFRGFSEEYPLGLLVADMPRLRYIFGEGFVGKVAAVRDHCWVSINHIFSDEVNLIPECPEEWLPQFASGIKTIVLIPVLPRGVLQLGSLEEVAEDINMVTHVKDRFNCLHSIGENLTALSLEEDFQSELSSTLISNPIDNLNAFTSMKTEGVNHQLAAKIVRLGSDDLGIASQVLTELAGQGALMPSGGKLHEAFIPDTENKIDLPLADVSNLSGFLDANQLKMVENKLFELSCLMEELQAYSEELQGYSDFNDFSVGVGESFNGMMKFYPAGDLVGGPCGGKDAVDRDNQNVSSSLTFPHDSELHKVFEPSSRKLTNGALWDSSIVFDNIYNISILPQGVGRSWFGRGDDGGYLLEDVVASVYISTDDTTSKKSDGSKSSDSFSGNTSASSKLQNQCKASSLLWDDSVRQNNLTSTCINDERSADSTSDTLRSTMCSIFSKEYKERKSDNKNLRNGQKTLNSCKRRAGPGDNQRPRPRDRQLIQDRVKELRLLVPNGSKCSIDGLLDRTIKHMMYLRSVADQAEKLRHCVHEELAGYKNRKFPETRENCQNGTSWAFEFGNESHVWPISVEDLAYPGHMLIEMLCNEQSLFLEIAQVVRGLELTILKGVLESRLNNTWARFVVEASKGFHRLDIFWPLMQLLQRKRKSISSKI